MSNLGYLKWKPESANDIVEQLSQGFRHRE